LREGVTFLDVNTPVYISYDYTNVVFRS